MTSELNNKWINALKILPAVCLVVFISALPVHAAKAILKKIVVGENPFEIELFVTDQVPFKVIQVEPREILIAFKHVDIDQTLQIQGEHHPDIQKIGVEKLQWDVLAVILKGKKPFGYIESGFTAANKSYKISLEKPSAKNTGPKAILPVKTRRPLIEKKPEPAVKKKEADIGMPAQEPPVKAVAAEDTPVQEKQTVAPKAPLVPPDRKYAGVNRPESRFAGDISDLVIKIASSPCSAQVISQSLALLERGRFAEAFSRLDDHVRESGGECMEQALFLKAYSFFRSVSPDDFTNMLQAERYFQDALVEYPQSEWVPYGFASMGLIQNALKNDAAAEGFFTLLLQEYPEYSGLPEAYYFLAGIYDEKGHTDRAERYYEAVFATFPMSRYTMDAGIGFGKVLYQKQQFIDSLSVINTVIEADPKKVYKSHDLLLYAGNANYKLGRAKPARDHLVKVSNLFPDISDKDVILSMVGDTYGMENNDKKAMEIYKYVREKYPDTQGFISSSIGLARYLEKNEDKIAIYEMIKTRFPEDTYARVAMMRIAEIYQSMGEYEKAIREIENLLATHPRGLRYEAVQLMQHSYEALFKIRNADDAYTDVLNIYERNHETIDRMGARSISLSVGLAYLKAKLYEQAFNHLLEAYKQYDLKSRSAELLYGLGVAMDETGRDEDALKMFVGFNTRFPRDKNRVDAMVRAGDIYLDNNKYNEASARFSQAYQLSQNGIEKGNIMVRHAQVYLKKQEYNQAAVLLTGAVKDYASAPGENYDLLAGTYREIGNTYLILNKYVTAAEAFSKALTFSDSDRLKANLGFLVGDAYQKGNVMEKAKDAYQSVADSNDSVWARLARQRLATLELAGTVQNS